MKLLIVSHTPHYRQGESLVGWGPTVREIDHLSSLFEEVVHIAPVHDGSAAASSLGYDSPRVRVHPVRPAGGSALPAKIRVLFRIPGWAVAILQEKGDADAIHVRCPAHISLVALLILFLTRKPRVRWVKYAGNWRPEGAEPVTYRLQRWLLRRQGHGALVTVNGRWSDQPDHVVPFNNPCLTREEVEDGREVACSKSLQPPTRVLFLGALIPGKGADVAIRSVARAKEIEPDIILEVVGEGEQRRTLERLVAELGLGNAVRFHGWASRPEVPGFLGSAHFILLPSRSEGFPKVVAEGMAYGVVPLAGAVSGIPQVLNETGSGRAIDPRDADTFAGTLIEFIRDPQMWRQDVEKGLEAAHLFSYDAMLRELVSEIRRRFNLELSPSHEFDALSS